MSLLSEFISEVKTQGLMKTARYTVFMPNVPSVLDKTVDPKLISMFCDQVQIPGLNYNTTPNLVYGETREAPYQRMFEPLTLSFYVDNKMKVKQYFDDWQHTIQDPVTRTFNYYNYYTSPIQLSIEDLENKSRYNIELRECYPKTVGAIQMDAASKDIMKLSVTLVYKYWVPVNAFNYDDADILNTTNDGLFSEISSGVISRMGSQLGGLLMNVGATKLQNAVTSLSG